MNNASLELGGTNWAEKDGNILGYSVGDTSGNFSPQEFTFARGSNLSATRIDRAGLIVKGRENLALQSNQFDTTWVNINSNETSGQSGYDGSNDAWILSKSASGGFIYQIANSYSGVYTFSVYAKANASNFIRLNGNAVTDADAFFNLSTGLVQSSINCIDVKIESVGNGWYRCSITSNDSALDYINIYPAEAGGISGNSGSVYIQDAQLEQGLAASPYIESGATNGTAGVLENTPRLNYTTGVANPYLLLEPSRTNIITNSEYLGGSDWIKSGNGTGSVPVITSNAAISPEGVQNATRVDLDLNGGTSSGDWSWVYQNFTSTGNDETFSMYVKAVDASNVGKVIAFGAVSFTAQSLTADWVRIESTSSAAVGGYGNGFRLRGTEGTSNTASFYVFGIQHEQNASYPTSYIPTYSVSATRAVDVCNKADASGEIGQTEGTFFIEAKTLSSSASNWIGFGANSSNRFLLGSTNGKVRLYYQDSGGAQSDTTLISSLDKFKAAVSYNTNTNSLVFYVNGQNQATLTVSGFTSTLDSIENGNLITSTQRWEGDVNKISVFPTALTNAELATLTTI